MNLADNHENRDDKSNVENRTETIEYKVDTNDNHKNPNKK